MVENQVIKTARLGCRTFGNDINPVAHVIQRGSLEFPQRFGKPITYTARKLLALTETEVGHLYPKNVESKRPIAYYWASPATCANPSWRAEVPLLKGFYLCEKPDKKVYLKPDIRDGYVDFVIEEGICTDEGFVHSRKSLRCPVCGNATDNALILRWWQLMSSTVRLCEKKSYKVISLINPKISHFS